MAPVRIAIGNNKGGVGKSTVAVRLAEALAVAACRVLVVDFDPQGNASRRLGWTWDPQHPQLTISEAVRSAERGVAGQVRQPIGWDTPWAGRIALCPARLDLENRSSEAGQVGAWRRLAKALDGADDDVDFTLIDCPPSLGHLTQMAVAAAQWGFAPTDASFDGVEAATRYRDFMAVSGEDLGNSELGLLGVVMTDYDGRIEGHQEHRKPASRNFGELFFDAIPRRAALANADGDAVPLEQAQGHDLSSVRAAFDIIGQKIRKRVGVTS